MHLSLGLIPLPVCREMFYDLASPTFLASLLTTRVYFHSFTQWLLGTSWPIRTFIQGFLYCMLTGFHNCLKPWRKNQWPVYSLIFHASKTSTLTSWAASLGWTSPYTYCQQLLSYDTVFSGKFRTSPFTRKLSWVRFCPVGTLSIVQLQIWKPLLP